MGRCLRGKGKAWALLVVFLAVAFSIRYALAEDAYSFLQLEITVYRDGVAHVRSIVAVNSTVPSISLLLPGEVANVIVTDEKGQLLSYELTRDSIVIYTFGALSLVLEYDTATLTRKDGLVWTLKIELPVQGRILLPDGAAIVYISERPESIEAKEGRPVLTLAPGSWEISYVIPVQVTTTASTATAPASTPTASTTSALTSTLTSISSPFPIAAGVATVAIIALIVGLAVFLRRRSRFPSEELSPLDNEVLQFIRSRGGRVFEFELRDYLGLPKTSAWRRVKRLEKMGLIRTRKVGSQNEVELA